MPLAQLKTITVYIPIKGDTSKLDPSFEVGRSGYQHSDLQAIYDFCPDLKPIYEILLKEKEVGHMGDYAAVCNMAITYESYIPGDGSNPTAGNKNQPSLVKSLKFTTFAEERVLDASIERFAKHVINAHPWEHPVIEIYSGVKTLNPPF